MTKRFEAHVQYDDWVGTAAADDSDEKNIRKMLEEGNQIKAGEFVLGIRLWVGENVRGEVQKPHVSALLIDKGDYDSVATALKSARGPLQLRGVTIELSNEQFLGLFKRFAVEISRKGIAITGREYTD